MKLLFRYPVPSTRSAYAGVLDAVHELRQDVQSLRLEQRAVAGSAGLVFSPTSYARTYQEAIRQALLTPTTEPRWFAPVAEPPELLPVPLASDAKEDVVQRYFEEHVARILDSAVCTPTMRLVGKSTAVSFGTRKPDVVGYITDAGDAGALLISQSTGYICCIGDLKARRAAPAFTDHEKGHLLSLVEDLVREQPWRGELARVVAFLSDCDHIVFFECVFRVEARPTMGLVVKLESGVETCALPLASTGGALLAGLVSAPVANLGSNHPRRVHLIDQQSEPTVEAYLGMGSTAMGFSGRLNSSKIVLKRYHPLVETAVRDSEVAALSAARGVPGLCQFIGRDASGGVLALEPVGAVRYSMKAAAMPLAPVRSGLWSVSGASGSSSSGLTRDAADRDEAKLPRAADFCDLVDALAGLHSVGLVHRDPRPSNFFRTADGGFFLADFGSAAKVGEDCTVDGRPWAFPYGPLAALVAMEAHARLPPASPSDDFEQVARLVYATLTRYAPPAHAGAADILTFWNHLRDLQPLATLLSAGAGAAEGSTGRDAFKDVIRQVMA